MVSTVLATEMSSAIRGLEMRRAQITRDVQVPTAQVLNWIALALRTTSALLDREAGDREAGRIDAETRAKYVIVDRFLTRC